MYGSISIFRGSGSNIIYQQESPYPFHLRNTMRIPYSKEMSMVWAPENWAAKFLKEYNHFNYTKGIEDINLMKFVKDKALKDFFLMVFNHLKEQYKDVIVT